MRAHGLPTSAIGEAQELTQPAKEPTPQIGSIKRTLITQGGHCAAQLPLPSFKG